MLHFCTHSHNEKHVPYTSLMHVQLFRKRKDKFPMHLEQTYLRYMTFVIESAIRNMKNGQEQWVWVLDLAGELQAACDTKRLCCKRES